MRLVIDANILFAGLLKNSSTRQLILKNDFELVAPKHLLAEISKYASELQERAKLEPEEFATLLGLLLSKITFIPDEETIPFKSEAEQLVLDKKDLAYAACALCTNAGIWSNDKHFQTGRIKSWTTKELLEKTKDA